MSERIVVVLYREEAGSFWADSQDLPGYSAGANSLGALRSQVHSSIAEAFPGEAIDLREAWAPGGKRRGSIRVYTDSDGNENLDGNFRITS